MIVVGIISHRMRSSKPRSDVDEVTQEVLRHKFDAIADQMETALLRSAYSSIVKEAQDASAAIFDPSGKTVAQAAAIPAHLGMLIPAVNTIIKEFPPDQMKQDDVYLINDPYDGGTHLPDITVVMPIFNEGEVVALGTSMAHHQEIGGMTPGSVPTDATEIFQEGLRLPPLKLHDQGSPNETVFEIIRRNVRIPSIVIGDLNAQISACMTGKRRISDLATEYGNDIIRTATEQLFDQSEQLTRSHLQKIPDGDYTFHDYIDDDGITHHEPIRIQATVEVEGSDFHVDFSGTAEQANGPVNSVPAATMSAVYFVVRAITDPNIPNNAGCFEPVSMHLPRGSIVNPEPPAPVNARTVTIKRIADVLQGALTSAIPDQIPAASHGQLAMLTFAGRRDDGTQWIYGETGAGGFGARPTIDGVDCIESDTSNCMNTPVEATELEYPLRVHQYELWQDSGGAGRYRGGLGYRKQIEVLDDKVTFTHRRDRHDFQPWGLKGGYPAPTCNTVVHRSSGKCEILPSKVVIELEEGDIVDVFTTGGGGHGPPLLRPLRSVRKDLKEEKISKDAATGTYGAIFTESGHIDVKLSEQQREREYGNAPECDVNRGEWADIPKQPEN